MKARISPVAYVYAGGAFSPQGYRETLQELSGQWVDIETEHLFDNQYNTANGLRLYDTMIDAIEDEAREGKQKCGWCGTISETTFTICLNCLKDEYLEPFTEKNCAFLAWKGIKPKVKPIEERQFGTYYLSNTCSGDLNYYRISNARKTINFIYEKGVFWVHNGIGYQRRTVLDMPIDPFLKLKKHLDTKI